MTSLGVTSGGDPSQWHGSFDCVKCGRKRLPAVDFSANAVSKHRKDATKPMRCKQCTASAEETERALASTMAKLRVKESGTDTPDTTATHACSECKQSKTPTEFSNKQLIQKGPGKQRCRLCSDAGEANAAAVSKTSTELKLKQARDASAEAERTNDPCKVAVFAKEAALEAELVTGLKPRRMGGGRGRGGGVRGNSTLGRGGRSS